MSDNDWEDDCIEDIQRCDGCGRDVNGYDAGDPCPLCCPSSYAPGSEECDWCTYSEECARLYARLLK